MKHPTRTIALMIWCAFSSVLLAAGVQTDQIVVIVNPAAAPLSRTEVVDLYLGRSSGWTPIDQTADSPIYAEFYRRVVGRDSAQVKAIWSRILFTGRGLPPRQLPDSAAMKRAVAANPKAVGYIEKSALDASVKVAVAVD